jgi:hypothetical protein
MFVCLSGCGLQQYALRLFVVNDWLAVDWLAEGLHEAHRFAGTLESSGSARIALSVEFQSNCK